MAAMCQKRTVRIFGELKAACLKGSGTSSRQPAVLPRYGIDGILRIGFWLLASSRQAPTDLAPLLLAAQIWLLTNFFKKILVAATVYKTNG